jgi:hypothetical protein
MEKKAPMPDVAAAIKRRLMLLAETYRKDITPEMTQGYLEALGDLSELEVEIAFVEASKRYKFFPNPAEIREALNLARDKFPAKLSAAVGTCGLCHGTGFKSVAHPKAHEDPAWANATIAVRCNHEVVAA